MPDVRRTSGRKSHVSTPNGPRTPFAVPGTWPRRSRSSPEPRYRSVWPCALFHLSWNVFNPMLLGDVYAGHPGLFGLLLHGLLAVWLFRGWTRAPSAAHGSGAGPRFTQGTVDDAQEEVPVAVRLE
jgi:hypothetical protein